MAQSHDPFPNRVQVQISHLGAKRQAPVVGAASAQLHDVARLLQRALEVAEQVLRGQQQPLTAGYLV